MAVTNRIPQIKLSKDEEERLKQDLDDKIGAAEEFRENSKWSALHESYWRQYLAEPKHEIKNSPWENASNLFIPMTQVAVNGVVANEFDAMLANDPTVRVVGYDDSNQANIDMLSSYYDQYYYRRVLNLKWFGHDLLLENSVDGTAVVKIRQKNDRIVRRSVREQITPIMKTVESRDALGNPFMDEIQVDQTVEVIEEATVERESQTTAEIVDLDRIYFAPDSCVTADGGPRLDYPNCRWYYTDLELTWADLLERRSAGYDIPESFKQALEERELSDKEVALRRKEGLSETLVEETLNVKEFFMRWPLPARFRLNYEDAEKPELNQKQGDEDGIAEEVIVTYAPKERHLLRIMPLSRLYPDGIRPHLIMHYHRLPRYIYGIGIPSKLRHINAFMNATANQFVDYGTLANMPYYFYNPGAVGLMPDMVGLRPGQGIPTPDPRGVVFNPMRTDPNFWLSAMNVGQAWGERVSAITDLVQGRASNLPNAPRTARGTVAMIQQATLAFSILVAQHAETPVEMFRRIHALKRQHASRDEKFFITDASSGLRRRMTIPPEAFQEDVDFQFILNPNRIAEQQTKQALFGITMQAFELSVKMPMYATAIRQALGDVYQAFGQKNFEKVYPTNLLPQFTGGPGVPTSGGPPQQQGPPRPPQNMMENLGGQAGPGGTIQ